ncbi:hypothetical protein VTJ04DRAFT_5947 [Mycothermus thermophilus]|uniref:uncharacterized protein n=1 Tax=Humicola insolens TaxID=85995 RepID=UPI0037425F6C
MLPTPSTSHVPYSRVYEPAEDSFLLLDTFSLPSETSFLSTRFPATSSSSPLLLEVGPGSGVVLAFLAAHASTLFGRPDILTLGVDVNWFACEAARETVRKAVDEVKEEEEKAKKEERTRSSGYLLATAQGDLASPLRPNVVDILVFNPPYVPTDELPTLPKELADLTATAAGSATTNNNTSSSEKKKSPPPKTTYDQDSTLLALAYAGGRDGMQVTDRLLAALPEILSERGVAYVLLCAQNRPEQVKERIRAWPGSEVDVDNTGMAGVEGRRKRWKWMAETVGTSGNKAGWEKLQVVRIWREVVEE